jgi:hypothetical protein
MPPQPSKTSLGNMVASGLGKIAMFFAGRNKV